MAFPASQSRRSATFITLFVVVCSLHSAEPERTAWAEILVTDAQTKRGVPLVELETVNNLKFITDNAGRVAFGEPGLLGREVFFYVRSHGYEVKKDGFGFAGVRITPKPGQVSEITMTRKNLAERMCRLTGEGMYRDSTLLGHKAPLKEPPNPGLVAGQDSVQAVRYQDQIYWFWGDTNRINYPLGLFRTAGARTPIPKEDTPPDDGIAHDYFVEKSGFARAMILLQDKPEGVIWLDGVCTVADGDAKTRLVAHYSRRKGLKDELEHGIALFNDDKAIFEPLEQLPLEEKWRFPHGHPVTWEEKGKQWLLFGSPALNVRVPATLKALRDPTQYESFTCAKSARDGKPTEVQLEDKRPVWRWQKELPPVDSAVEHGWWKTGKLQAEHTRFCPADADTPTERIYLHNGSVRWNAFRKRWVLLAGQFGGKSSFLGEVWYSESEHPSGPFAKAVKVVTHDRQTFYNVCHHDFLDRNNGRTIYFEGTYTHTFSGNADKTQRYEYNQILYRLDLDSEGLRGARN